MRQRYVVNTHWHNDHTQGNQAYFNVFPWKVEFLAHTNTRRDILNRAIPHVREQVKNLPGQIRKLEEKLAGARHKTDRARLRAQIESTRRYLEELQQINITLPTLTFDRSLFLHGKRDIHTHYFGRGHTAGDVVVLLAKERILISGDLFLGEHIPFARDSYPSEWAATLKAVRQLDFDLVILGHTAVEKGEEAKIHFANLIAFFEDVVPRVRAMVAAGKSLDQVKAELDLTKYKTQFANFATHSGLAIGGPVYLPGLYKGKDKTFFFLSYEGFRNRALSAVRFLTVPLPEMYQGDFSNWRDQSGNLIRICDPATTRSDGAGGFIRDPFPGSRMPVERFSRVSREAIKFATMMPNVADPTGVLSPNPRNNFLSVSPGNSLSFWGGSSNPYDKYSAKVDHSFNDNNRVSFLYHRGVALESSPDEGDVPALPHPLGDFTFGDTKTRVYRLRWDRTISPRVFNQLRLGVNNQLQERASSSLQSAREQGGWPNKLGLTNLPVPDFMWPGISMDDYTRWSWAFFGNNKNKTFAAMDDISLVRGSHSLKFGFHYQIDNYNGGGCHTCSGSFGFSRLTTSLPLDQSGRTGNGFASMLLGEVATGNVTTERYVSDQWKYLAGYAQDDWRVTSKLTINYGLRWEHTGGHRGPLPRRLLEF